MTTRTTTRKKKSTNKGITLKELVSKELDKSKVVLTVIDEKPPEVPKNTVEKEDAIDEEIELEFKEDIETEDSDKKTHIKTARRLYTKLKNRIEMYKEYFKTNNSFRGITLTIMFNEDFSIVRMKFLYSHKKVIFIVKDEEVSYQLYERTDNLIKDLATLYKPVEDTIVKPYVEVRDSLHEIMDWCFIKSNKTLERVFATPIKKENYAVEDRLSHILYYGLILDYKVIEETDKETVIGFTFLEDPKTCFNFTIAKDNMLLISLNTIKENPSLLVVNSKNEMNIFNLNSIKYLLDFSSNEYNRLIAYSHSFNMRRG